MFILPFPSLQMMDPMKYNSYLSGLYGCSSSGMTSTTSTPTSAGGDNKSSYNTQLQQQQDHQQQQQQQQELSPKQQYSGMSGETDGVSQSKASPYGMEAGGMGGQHDQQANNNHGIKTSYSADSLSRSYFDNAMALKGYNDSTRGGGGGQFDSSAANKSFTPDSMGSGGGGRASADSPDNMKMPLNDPSSSLQAQQQQFTSQQAALQAYYSQSMAAQAASMSGMHAGSGALPGSTGAVPSGGSGSAAASLPPLLPNMAAQLSQYAGAAAAAGAGQYAAQSAGSSSGGEYRRPLSVLF